MPKRVVQGMLQGVSTSLKMASCNKSDFDNLIKLKILLQLVDKLLDKYST